MHVFISVFAFVVLRCLQSLHTQVLPVGLILGGAVAWWALQGVQQQQHPRINKAADQDLLSALDREAAKTTSQYWFGPEDQQPAAAQQKTSQ
jgi:hypothetical protein